MVKGCSLMMIDLVLQFEYRLAVALVAAVAVAVVAVAVVAVAAVAVAVVAVAVVLIRAVVPFHVVVVVAFAVVVHVVFARPSLLLLVSDYFPPQFSSVVFSVFPPAVSATHAVVSRYHQFPVCQALAFLT